MPTHGPWIKVQTSLREHRKISRLARALGIGHAAAIGHLVHLWLYAADQSPDGDLSDFDDAEIAYAAAWEGETSKIVGALRTCGLLDVTEDRKALHDWHEYAASWKTATRMRAYRDRVRNERERNASVAGSTTVTPIRADQSGTDQSGEESSEPVRTPEPDAEGGAAFELELGVESGTVHSPFADRIWELWQEICVPVGLPAVTKLTDNRRGHLAARLKEDPSRGLVWWRAYFQRVAKAEHCLGKNDHGWKADFDFVIGSEDHVAKVLEGKYDKAWTTKPTNGAGPPAPTRPQGIDYGREDA